jgi:EpsI family protein
MYGRVLEGAVPSEGSPARGALLLAILAVAYLAGYATVVGSFVSSWLGRDEYSHGFLIPFISAYFVYQEREELRRVRPAPRILLGTAIVLLGSLLYLLGNRGGVVLVEQLAFLLLLPGLVILTLGPGVLRIVMLPLLYLGFMLPLIGDLGGGLYGPLQLTTAWLAEALLRLVGIPVLRTAETLHLPKVTLQVAEACSGVRYLISIVTVAVPAAIMTQRRWWRRTAIVLSAIVIGILANGVRVALIGFWVTYGSREVLHGPYHLLQGLFVSCVGYAFLLILAVVTREPAQQITCPAPAAGGRDGAGERVSGAFRAAWLIALVFVLGVPSYARLRELRSVRPAEGSPCLPSRIGQWEGTSPRRTTMVQQADYAAEKAYVAGDGRRVEIAVGYFCSQRPGRRVTGLESVREHSAAGVVPLVLSDGRKAEIRLATEDRDGTTRLTAYWFSIDGMVLASGLEATIRTAIDGLVRNRNNGSVVILTSDVPRGSEGSAALRGMLEIAREAESFLRSQHL